MPRAADRLEDKCTRAFAKAVAALQDYLDAAEPEKAAAIVADLIKFRIAHPEEKRGDRLDEIVAAAMRGEVVEAWRDN